MQEVDRTRRVSELIKRELANIIPRELQDERINSVTVTAATVSRDLKRSTIYVSAIGDSVNPELIEKLMNKSARFLRHHLSQQVDLRVTPVLVFKYDSSIQRGVELTNLIDKLNRGNAS